MSTSEGIRSSASATLSPPHRSRADHAQPLQPQRWQACDALPPSTKRARTYTGTEVINHPRDPRSCAQFRSRRPLPINPIWTRNGREADAHTYDRTRSPLPKTRGLQAKPSDGLEPTTPSLPMEGSRRYGRPRALTGAHEIPANSRIRSVRPLWPIYGRCGSSGRGVDALHSPIRLPDFPG